MLNVSPYADAESGAPLWRTGERESAIVFLSLALYIILDVNVSIYRVFRKKRGLYYWSLISATWGTAVVVVGNIFKNLKPEWGVLWPLWTFLINGGWSIYAPAELLILYSRLHLVNQNDRLHRHLLIMIIVGSTLIIIPNWVFIFPAYDIDPATSSEWSPRMAIIDRVSQAGFTVFEIIISSVYIHSLRDILCTKINTRTRRVMRDLIIVNITVICMDLLVIILIFLNQANLAYPLQDLTYSFKYKIEFAVLNQLMAVAASGSRYSSRQTTWEEKRYRRPGHATILKGYSDDDLTGVRLPFLSTSMDGKPSPQSTLVASENHVKDMETTTHTSIAKPPSIIAKIQVGADSNVHKTSINDAAVRMIDQDFAFLPGPDLALSAPSSSLNGAGNWGGALEGKNSNDGLLAPIPDDGNDLTLVNAQESLPLSSQRNRGNRVSLRQVIFGKPANTNFQMSTGRNLTQFINNQDRDERSRIAPFSSTNFECHDLPESHPIKPTQKSSVSPFQRALGRENSEQVERKQFEDGNEKEEEEEEEEEEGKDEEEEDGLHAWERHGTGNSKLEAPWFYKHGTDSKSPSKKWPG